MQGRSGPRKLFLGVGVVLVLAVATALAIARSQDQEVEVRVEEVQTRDLSATISATGNIRARRQVNISSDVMGRVVELTVEEGDEVDAGQVLLRIDPSQLRATVSRATAALSQARAQLDQQRAGLIQAEWELDRVRSLRERDPGLVSVQRLQEAESQVDVQLSLLASARHGVEQAEAGLVESQDQLGRTTIRSPMSGRVTRLNIEEGETVVVGTMNNPGSLLLTISDLSVIEVVLAVDETDVSRISIGDPASVEIDALAGARYAASVSRIGSSAIRDPTAGGAGGPVQLGRSVDYEVVLTLAEPTERLRPDLSAHADIVVESRTGVPSIPIIAVTVLEDEDGVEREGVFVVRDGRVEFRPVELGITGEEHFELLSGLEVGDSVVSGPFQRIRELREGDAVRISAPPRSGG